MKTEEKLMNPAEKMQETKLMEERNKNLIRRGIEELYNKGNYTNIDEFLTHTHS